MDWRPFPPFLANFGPQKRNPDLPRTPIYRGFLPAPKTHGKSGFNCMMVGDLPNTILRWTILCKSSITHRETMLVQNLTFKLWNLLQHFLNLYAYIKGPLKVWQANDLFSGKLLGLSLLPSHQVIQHLINLH